MSSQYADWITYESSDVWIVFLRHLQDIMIHQDNLWYDFVVLIWFRKQKFELCIYSLFFIMICIHLFLYFHANLRWIFDVHEFLLSLVCYSFQYLAVSCLCWINNGWRGRFPSLYLWQCLVSTCSNCRSRQTKRRQTDTEESCEQRYEPLQCSSESGEPDDDEDEDDDDFVDDRRAATMRRKAGESCAWRERRDRMRQRRIQRPSVEQKWSGDSRHQRRGYEKKPTNSLEPDMRNKMTVNELDKERRDDDCSDPLWHRDTVILDSFVWCGSCQIYKETSVEIGFTSTSDLVNDF